jgi:hypothetical protein
VAWPWILLAGWAFAQGPAGAPAPSAVKDWSFTLQKQGRTHGRFRGASALPVPGVRAFDVTGFHVDTFREDGEPEIAADSPACRVSITNDSFVVTSPGELKIAHADGRFELSGEGFH